MPEDFLPPVDVEQRARRCIRENNLRIAYERITALVELLNDLPVKFIKTYRAAVRLDGDLREILKGLDDLSNLQPELANVRGMGHTETSKWPSSFGRIWCAARSLQPARSGRLC